MRDSALWQDAESGDSSFQCIEGPTDGRLPHPQAIEMGSPFVIGHDGTRVVISWLETAARRTAP
jgi:hypothetical protein